MRIVEEVPDGAVIVDCVTRITTPAVAARMKADGVSGVFQYVGRMSSADPGLLSSHVDAILAGGLAFLGVCFADQFDGGYRAQLFRAAGALDGLTLAADLESYAKPAAACDLALRAFYHDVTAAKFLPCLYNGISQPLDANALGALPFRRYWKSGSNVVMPVWQGKPIGYSMIQHVGDPRDPSVDWRHVMRGGVNVDVDTPQADNQGRRCTWMREAA